MRLCPYNPEAVRKFCCQGTPWAHIQLTTTIPGLFLQSYALVHPSLAPAVTGALPSLRQHFSMLNFMRSRRTTLSTSWWQSYPQAYWLFPYFGANYTLRTDALHCLLQISLWSHLFEPKSSLNIHFKQIWIACWLTVSIASATFRSWKKLCEDRIIRLLLHHS